MVAWQHVAWHSGMRMHDLGLIHVNARLTFDLQLCSRGQQSCLQSEYNFTALKTPNGFPEYLPTHRNLCTPTDITIHSLDQHDQSILPLDFRLLYEQHSSRSLSAFSILH
jgi:hypothetical protein